MAHFYNGVSILGETFSRTGCQFGVPGGTYPPKNYPSAPPGRHQARHFGTKLRARPHDVFGNAGSTWSRSLLSKDLRAKSLDNNDRDQVEPAIPKTSCGLAHSFVPKWHSEKPFCHASVAELRSCTYMYKIKKGESIQRIKAVFFLIHP